MAVRTARAEWTGSFIDGQGVMKPGSGFFEAGYTSSSILSDGPGTNPMEVLGASLAGCFCGGLAAVLTKNNYPPQHICTDAQVQLTPVGRGFTIAKIHLHANAEVPGIDEASFLAYAEHMVKNCPVAQALSAIEITLQAELVR